MSGGTLFGPLDDDLDGSAFAVEVQGGGDEGGVGGASGWADEDRAWCVAPGSDEAGIFCVVLGAPVTRRQVLGDVVRARLKRGREMVRRCVRACVAAWLACPYLNQPRCHVTRNPCRWRRCWTWGRGLAWSGATGSGPRRGLPWPAPRLPPTPPRRLSCCTRGPFTWSTFEVRPVAVVVNAGWSWAIGEDVSFGLSIVAVCVCRVVHRAQSLAGGVVSIASCCCFVFFHHLPPVAPWTTRRRFERADAAGGVAGRRDRGGRGWPAAVGHTVAPRIDFLLCRPRHAARLVELFFSLLPPSLRSYVDSLL